MDLNGIIKYHHQRFISSSCLSFLLFFHCMVYGYNRFLISLINFYLFVCLSALWHAFSYVCVSFAAHILAYVMRQLEIRYCKYTSTHTHTHLYMYIVSVCLSVSLSSLRVFVCICVHAGLIMNNICVCIVARRIKVYYCCYCIILYQFVCK